jgi:ribonuclease HI
MSPITEEAAKELVQALLATVAKCRNQEMEIRALESALEKALPPGHDEFSRRLKQLRDEKAQREEDVNLLMSMQRLEALLKA